MKSNFRLPGPTPLPPHVVAAMQREMIPHRGGGLSELFASILTRTKEIHRTDGDVFLWPASGSAGWEVAIVNLLSPGDPVLAVVTGNFGERFAQFGEMFGLDVRRHNVAWGHAVTPAALRDALDSNPDVRAVFITHNETSTGVTNPLPELAAVVRDHGALVLVDGVSSVAGLPFHLDDWGVDFVLSGSQKAWMAPPGLLIAGFGPRAWDAYQRSTFPKFFWDIQAARNAAARGMTPTTPPLTLLYAFDAALDLILDEGIVQVWQRHLDLGERTRAGVRDLGLSLLADGPHASGTITAFLTPEGVTSNEIVDALRRDHGITVASGQAHLAETVVRIGHMGWVDADDIDNAIAGLRLVMSALTAGEVAGVGARR
ncbi:MAG: pyridoxal-phosphate-dependent aminotransferase family protein [Thermomicrobiales bacterium]